MSKIIWASQITKFERKKRQLPPYVAIVKCRDSLAVRLPRQFKDKFGNIEYCEFGYFPEKRILFIRKTAKNTPNASKNIASPNDYVVCSATKFLQTVGERDVHGRYECEFVKDEDTNEDIIAVFLGKPLEPFEQSKLCNKHKEFR